MFSRYVQGFFWRGRGRYKPEGFGSVFPIGSLGFFNSFKPSRRTSASDRNYYRGYLLGVKASSLTNSYADCLEIVVATISRSHQGLSRSVMGKLYPFLPGVWRHRQFIFYTKCRRERNLSMLVLGAYVVWYIILNANHKFFVQRKALRGPESAVSLERGVCSCAESQIFSCYKG